eukprot:9632074-Prorocentrum_lima.AAC.1
MCIRDSSITALEGVVEVLIIQAASDPDAAWWNEARSRAGDLAPLEDTAASALEWAAAAVERGYQLLLVGQSQGISM